MSRTKHHNAPKRGKQLKLPDRRVGWFGEFLYAQLGRQFRKRTEHRALRRWNRKETAVRVDDAVNGVDIPLPFERQEYIPAQPKLPPVQRWRKRPLVRSAFTL